MASASGSALSNVSNFENLDKENKSPNLITANVSESVKLPKKAPKRRKFHQNKDRLMTNKEDKGGTKGKETQSKDQKLEPEIAENNNNTCTNNCKMMKSEIKTLNNDRKREIIITDKNNDPKPRQIIRCSPIHGRKREAFKARPISSPTNDNGNVGNSATVVNTQTTTQALTPSNKPTAKFPPQPPPTIKKPRKLIQNNKRTSVERIICRSGGSDNQNNEQLIKNALNDQDDQKINKAKPLPDTEDTKGVFAMLEQKLLESSNLSANSMAQDTAVITAIPTVVDKTTTKSKKRSNRKKTAQKARVERRSTGESNSNNTPSKSEDSPPSKKLKEGVSGAIPRVRSRTNSRPNSSSRPSSRPPSKPTSRHSSGSRKSTKHQKFEPSKNVVAFGQAKNIQSPFQFSGKNFKNSSSPKNGQKKSPNQKKIKSNDKYKSSSQKGSVSGPGQDQKSSKNKKESSAAATATAVNQRIKKPASSEVNENKNEKLNSVKAAASDSNFSSKSEEPTPIKSKMTKIFLIVDSITRFPDTTRPKISNDMFGGQLPPRYDTANGSCFVNQGKVPPLAINFRICKFDKFSQHYCVDYETPILQLKTAGSQKDNFSQDGDVSLERKQLNWLHILKERDGKFPIIQSLINIVEHDMFYCDKIINDRLEISNIKGYITNICWNNLIELNKEDFIKKLDTAFVTSEQQQKLQKTTAKPCSKSCTNYTLTVKYYHDIFTRKFRDLRRDTPDYLRRDLPLSVTTSLNNSSLGSELELAERDYVFANEFRLKNRKNLENKNGENLDHNGVLQIISPSCPYVRVSELLNPMSHITEENTEEIQSISENTLSPEQKGKILKPITTSKDFNNNKIESVSVPMEVDDEDCFEDNKENQPTKSKLKDNRLFKVDNPYQKRQSTAKSKNSSNPAQYFPASGHQPLVASNIFEPSSVQSHNVYSHSQNQAHAHAHSHYYSHMSDRHYAPYNLAYYNHPSDLAGYKS